MSTSRLNSWPPRSVSALFLDVLAQRHHQIGAHPEHARRGLIESEIVEHAATYRSDMPPSMFTVAFS